MGATAIRITVLILQIFGILAAPSGFGCEGKISDEMRSKMLDFHNQARVRLSRGEQKNANGRLSAAQNMYQLKWDCELEKRAAKAIAQCPEDVSDLYGFGYNIGKRGNCPKYPKTQEQLVMSELNNWWNEVQKIGLKNSENRYTDPALKEFANMANGKNTKVGCSVNFIKGKTFIMCVYDEDATKEDRVIYESGTACKKDGDCTTYQNSECGSSGLCVGVPEPGYKEKLEAEERACNDETGMTAELRKLFLDIYNTYRSSLARGLEPDALGDYAPKAKRMLQMVYDCPTEKKAFKLAKECPPRTRNIYSHFWNMHNISSPSVSNEDAAREATSRWWSELRINGVGKENIYSVKLLERENGPESKPVSHYMHMAKDFSYLLGCVIQQCDDGKYVHCLNGPRGPQPVRKPIYQVGDPCVKDSDCKGKYVCLRDQGMCRL